MATTFKQKYKMKKHFLIALFIFTQTAYAQHEHHQSTIDTTKAKPKSPRQVCEADKFGTAW
jgi:hypothetical protein